MARLSALAGAPFNFLQALRDRDHDWRWVAVMIAAIPASGFIMTLPVVIAMEILGHGDLFAAGPGPRLQRSAVFLVEVAGSLAALAVGILIAAKLIFRRPVRSWITAAPRFRWRLLIWAAGFTCAGVGLLMAVDAFVGDKPQLPLLDQDASASLRLIYATAALGAFLVAAWAEEVVFRGYLLQQVGAFTRHTWVAIAISSVAFALMHLEFDPAALAARTLAGAAFAWAALRLGGLEFAIGAHLATNLMIALVQAPMMPDDGPPTGGLEDVTLEVLLAAYVVFGVELARRQPRLIGATAISSPA